MTAQEKHFNENNAHKFEGDVTASDICSCIWQFKNNCSYGLVPEFCPLWKIWICKSNEIKRKDY